jgi:hypothetical protein
MRGLAAVEMELGRNDEARRQLEWSLALRERVHGPVHWEVAQSLADLAEVARLQGDRRAEETYLRRALAISRQVFAASHPELAIAVAQLGDALCRNRGHAEGTALLSEAITLRQATAAGGDADLAAWRRSRDACAPR